MIGGFLGAGKTTTLNRLARHYQLQGHRVGLVTNDQADGLVDTETLRRQGWTVEEVAGACFCCRFPELVDRLAALTARQRPDVILAEPVGSCTDLVATVIQPLRRLYSQQVQVAPYVVLFKPSHGQRILRGEPAGGFSPKAAYIFRKQLEEADAIALNRIDELSQLQRQSLLTLVQHHYPDKPVIPLSARTGEGFEALLEVLEQPGNFGRHILEIDYDTYAEGETELGWLNTTSHWESTTPFSLDEIVFTLVGQLAEICRCNGAEIAHVKAIGWDQRGIYAVANAISNEKAAQLSLSSGIAATAAEVVLNARVAADPSWLAEQYQQVALAEGKRRGIQVAFVRQQSLRPGRPVPTHRYNQVVD
jgi:G3E family GTPase